MPKLVILNADADVAGVGINLKRAFDKYTNWETRAVCRATNYLDYPTDIVWPYNEHGPIARQVGGLVSAADVVHVMDDEGALHPFRSRLRGKTIVVHYLGSHYRRNRRRAEAVSRSFRAIQVTCEVDLMSDAVGFLGTPADLEAIAAFRNAYQLSDRIRIGHAPTNRTVASTERVIEVVKELATRYPIDFDLIEGVSNRECLERKAQLDIFVDRFTLGFGVNDLECAALGIPVVAGLAGEEVRKRAFSMWGQLPFADATPETLPTVLERLVSDLAWRAELVDRARDFAANWYSERAVVTQALRIYGRETQQVLVPAWQDAFG